MPHPARPLHLPTPPSHGCVWIHSDLQLADPQQARAVLQAAVNDVLSLGLDLRAIWCLGDAHCGGEQAALEEVAETTVREFDRLAAPVCYVLGNHELDRWRSGQRAQLPPLYQRARTHPNWHTMDRPEDFFFMRVCCGHRVIFMGDHLDPAGHWWTSHGQVAGDAPQRYPHGPAAYRKLREAIATESRPVLFASHYAFPGGQRPSALMSQLLPLPPQVRLHVFGHAHIGDRVWNAEAPYQREHRVSGQSLRQFNISALENLRSPGSHAAFLTLGPQGPESLRIRCHQTRTWLEHFDLNPADRQPSATAP